MNNVSEPLRWVFTAFGAIIAMLEPTLPYLIICTLMIFADCYTAWSLSKRAKKLHPDKISEDGAKFKSHNYGKVIMTLIKAYALIVMAYLIQQHITNGLPVNMTKVAAGAICFWQLWSILENESSSNGSKWAKVMQKVLVDKTSRHFDIDLNELNKESNEGIN